jgi:hypothetical protein
VSTRNRRAAAVAALVVASTAAVVVASTPALAATVPNMFDCSRITNQCRQTNGPHVPGIIDSCRWVWFVSAPTMTTAVGDTWR